MLRSMFSGVSGLRSHQTMMDVIGNNIANVNTTGYKSSQVVFQDLLSQMLNGAGAASNNTGGTNPAQIGLGVKVGGILTNYSQGAAQLTGRSTDLSIAGDGFFVVHNGTDTLYTRAGALSFDTYGRLVTPDGGIIQGWPVNDAGVVDTNASPIDLTLPLGKVLAPKLTSLVTLGGNIPGGAMPTDTTKAPVVTTSVTVVDQQGTAVPITLKFTQTSDTEWDVKLITPDDSDGTSVGTVAFDETGKLTSTDPLKITVAGNDIDVDISALSNYAGAKTLTVDKQDGRTMGSLQSFSIAQDGTISGVFSNGITRQLGQIAMASFSNPGGLEKAGGSSFRATVNSGLANIGTAGSGGRGTMTPGTLEMSNVDLAQEFTNLIISQRGFQANSRVISASDELLQDLVNLKR